MSLTRPTALGIIACPGGEKIAEEIIGHLKTIHQSRFEKKSATLSKLYNITKEEALKKLNFTDDLISHRVTPLGDPSEYRPPSIKIPANFTRFANGEYKTDILRSIRDQDVYIVQDVANETPLKFCGSEERFNLSVNDHLMILFTTIDAAIQSGAKRVSLVLPAYPYSRQHKKRGREGLTASMLGRIFENLGVARIITLDIHSKEIEHTFSSLALEDLHASYQILLTLSEHIDLVNEDIVVVSPDTGAIDRNKYYAASLNKPLALLYKERDYTTYSKNAQDSNIKSARLLGDVKDKTVFMADDMLGTGGTLIKAIKIIREMGAKKIICNVSLPLFSGNAVEHFDEAFKKGYFNLLVGTNAVYLPEEILKKEWYLSANVSNLFARAISRIHQDRSISPLLDNSKLIQKMLQRRKSVDTDD